ncbi:MAG: arylsulfatase A [Verrucomicrobiales bacterium]|jgi:arylsulfatase A
MKSLIVLLLLTVGAVGQAPKPKPTGRTVLPADLVASLEAHEDLTYANYGERSLQLDLYRPKSAKGKTLPAIVCIHGGGWANGNRAGHANMAKSLAARGYVAVTISYRLSGEKPFPAAIHDCKAAVRWLRANAEKYGVDSEKIGAAGLSAGGHLVALLATSAGVPELEGEGGNPDQSSAIQAAVPMGAQSHLLSERNRKVSAEKEIWKAFLSGSQEEQPARYRLASPLVHLDAEDPPVAFLSGEFDDPSTHADAFRAKMKELGIDSGYTPIDGGPHGFIGGQNWFDQGIEITAAFFKKHL